MTLLLVIFIESTNLPHSKKYVSIIVRFSIFALNTSYWHISIWDYTFVYTLQSTDGEFYVFGSDSEKLNIFLWKTDLIQDTDHKRLLQNANDGRLVNHCEDQHAANLLQYSHAVDPNIQVVLAQIFVQMWSRTGTSSLV